MRRFSKDALLALSERPTIHAAFIPVIHRSVAAYLTCDVNEYSSNVSAAFNALPFSDFVSLTDAYRPMYFILAFSKAAEEFLDKRCR